MIGQMRDVLKVCVAVTLLGGGYLFIKNDLENNWLNKPNPTPEALKSDNYQYHPSPTPEILLDYSPSDLNGGGRDFPSAGLTVNQKLPTPQRS